MSAHPRPSDVRNDNRSCRKCSMDRAHPLLLTRKLTAKFQTPRLNSMRRLLQQKANRIIRSLPFCTRPTSSRPPLWSKQKPTQPSYPLLTISMRRSPKHWQHRTKSCWNRKSQQLRKASRAQSRPRKIQVAPIKAASAIWSSLRKLTNWLRSKKTITHNLRVTCSKT